MLRDLVMQNRSYRRFHQDVAITEETLKELVDLARNSASASNRQALKYIISSDPEKNAKIFPLLGFAAQYREWPGPAEGERLLKTITLEHRGHIVLRGGGNVADCSRIEAYRCDDPLAVFQFK